MPTTIQITPEEDREIAQLKQRLRLPSKKAVVLEGLHTLRQILASQKRRRRLKAASLMVRGESHRINLEWAPRSAALKIR